MLGVCLWVCVEGSLGGGGRRRGRGGGRTSPAGPTKEPWEQQGHGSEQWSGIRACFTGRGAWGLVADSSAAERLGFIIWSTCRTTGPSRLTRAVSARWALAIAEVDGLTHEGRRRKPLWSACPLEERQHGG